MKWKVRTIDGTEEDVTLPDSMPWTLGKEIKKNMSLTMKSRGKNKNDIETTFENPVEFLNKTEELLINKYLPDHISKDKITSECVDELIEHFMDDVNSLVSNTMQGEDQKKN